MVTEANIYPCNYIAAQSFNTSRPVAVRLPPMGVQLHLLFYFSYNVEPSYFPIYCNL